MQDNILSQVEKLLAEDTTRPEWVDEILFELREIKKLLQTQRESVQSRNDRKKAFFAFINMLRKRMRADIIEGSYPEIYYRGRTLGVNLKGYIYDKHTTADLSAQEAYEVYRFLYDNRSNLEKYIKS